MKIMLDTNVLISAFVFGGKIREVLIELFETNCALYVSDYVDKEFKRILQEKWSNRADKIYLLYRSMDFIFCRSTAETLGQLRDEKDIPVLSDALYHNVDIFLTGDKDFLEAGIDTPKIISPSDLLENFLRKGSFYG